MSNMKTFKDVLEYQQDYKTADTVNHEGFPAWKRQGIERLRELLFLGHIGNTFYVNSAQNIMEKVTDLEELILGTDIPVKTIADLIVSARNEGLFRTIPILALALLRKKDAEVFKQIFPSVVRTGNDLKDFLDLNRAISEGRGGYGRAVKTAIHRWLTQKVTPFYTLKYRNQIADGIAVSRPKVDDMNNCLLLKYTYASKKDIDEETAKAVTEKYPQIRASELFKLYIEKGDVENAVKVAQEGRLPADLMIGVAGNTDNPVFWKAVMNNMGLMQFVKYLNKLTKVGLVEEVVERLSSITPDILRDAKIFPYRLFVAWKNAEAEPVKKALENIINLYADYHIVDEAWLKYTWSICPDISGSMTWSSTPIKGGVRPSDVAGFFSSVLAKQLGVREILAWDTNINIIPVENCSVFEIYDRVANADGGGTAMNVPIDYMLKKYKTLPDIVVIITDNEHWASRRGLKSAWRDYKKRNKNAKLVVVEVVGYGTSQVDEKFAADYDVYTVFGWSETVFDWIKLKVI